MRRIALSLLLSTDSFIAGARREVEVEARQLGPVVDTVAGIAPVVDKILGLLGLQRKNAMSTESALPADVVGKIEELVGQATGGLPALPISLPGAAPAGGAPKAARADDGRPQWVQNGRNGGGMGGLPVQLDALPVSPPVSLPVGAPAPPAGAPAPGSAPPSGSPAPPANSPFSPPLPANPPNTPAAQAMSSPPLFEGAAYGNNNNGTDGYNCTAPANGTATSTSTAANESATGNAGNSTTFVCPPVNGTSSAAGPGSTSA